MSILIKRVVGRTVTSSLVGVAALLVIIPVGCQRSTPTVKRVSSTRGASGKQKDSDVLLRGIATTLNDLTNRVDLELNPEQPILTARTSDDGNEVLAACSRGPGETEGPYDYLYDPSGKIDFRQFEVQQGDIVRYYVNLDAEAAEQGFEDRKAIRLRVRRVDNLNPSALVLETGLTGEVIDPQRMEIWRFSDERTDAIGNILRRYYARRRPAIGWEPSPDENELQRVVERCNQWWRNQPSAADDWQVDPLLATLPEQLTANEHVAAEASVDALAAGRFADWEGRQLQQAVWCRDISNWVRGSAARKSELAAALFDWTVRHIQLVEPDEAVMVHHPWQALVYGRGTAQHRAWVFAELCRQSQIDVVVLALPSAEGGAAEFWLAAAWVDDALYLFDAQLGLPIPSPDGAVASTLKEVAADPKLLDQLDVADAFDYAPGAGGIEQVEAWVVASPDQLSRRNAVLQAELEGDEFVVLSANSAPLSDALSKHPIVAEVKLWPLPFESIVQQQEIKPSGRELAIESFEPFAVRPRLWKARMLHFLGRKDVSAKDRDDPLAAPQLGHQEAAQLYTNRLVRPPNKILESLDAEKRAVYETTKAAATFWVGLLNYDTQNYDVAVRWLGEMLPTVAGRAKWSHGARYNLARAYEALGDLPRAIELLESDPEDAPQRHGNLLRAKQLRAKLPSETPADESSEGAEG